MPTSQPQDRFGPRYEWIVAISMAIWLLAQAWNWPVALSLEDEVGYVGQAHLFLDGRVRPTADSPGIWRTSPQGTLSAKYPLFHPALLAPLLAISPRSAFALGVAASAALVLLAARLLRHWGSYPAWSVLLLAHPTISLLSRTVMADLLLSAFLLGTYLSMRANRRVSTVILIAATLLAKPTGTVVIALLIGGDVLGNWRPLRARDPQVIRKYIACGFGVALGAAAVMASNLIANGSPWFGYSERLGPPTFMPTFLLTTGAAHARSLLLLPPLLIVGIWPYWARRDFGPLTLILGLVGMMSTYYFVDSGRTWVDSLVLSQRLILPAVVFLTIGYLSLLANVVVRLSVRWGTWFRVATSVGLVVLPGLVGNVIAIRHRRWQEPMRQAMVAVSDVAGSLHTNRIALTGEALKYGLMFHGDTTLVPPANAQTGALSPSTPDIILCATKNPSYRATDVDFPCTTPGYRTVRRLPTCEILIRADRTLGE